LRAHALAREKDKPPYAHWDKNHEHICIHSYTQVANRKDRVLYVPRKYRFWAQKEKQPTDRDWGDGEEDRHFPSPCSQAKETYRCGDA
jgi:hypothetical protein